MLMSPVAELKRGVQAAASTFLVGDVGGTNCRLALAQEADGVIRLTHAERYKCADFGAAADAIDTYLRSLAWDAPLGAAVIAVAGPVSQGVVKSTNMHWSMSEAALKGHGAQRVRLVNDYTALALSVEHLQPEDLETLGPEVPGDPSDTAAVMGAGTGFGCGALARGVGGAAAIATEGGHISFAPVDEFEIELLKLLMRRFGRVSIERLLSGPGLVTLRALIAEVMGRPAGDGGPEDIVRTAEAGDDLSRQAIERFCAIYGAVAGDIALVYGARGGVFLGGGIAPAIAAYLKAGLFRERFEAKGRFRDYLAAVPTRIIMNTNAALIGAAHLASAISNADQHSTK